MNLPELPKLLHEGRGWQAWSKPAGHTVHNESPSLLEFLRKQQSAGEPHFLNRLDRDTSGIVITANQAKDIAELQKVWNGPETHKIYIGLHRRRRDPAVTAPEIWNDTLSDRSEGRKNPRGISSDRVPCVTRLFPLAENEHFFLSALALETGRQHQIRRHAVLHRLELVGDTRYGDPNYNLKLKSHRSDLRLGLHAFALLWKPHNELQKTVCPLPDFFTVTFPQAPTLAQAFVLDFERSRPV